MYKRFGELLVERAVISQLQLDEALHKQKIAKTHRRIGEVLMKLGYISKNHIIECLSIQLGIPIVKLSDREISERTRNLVDPNIATLYRVIPVEERGRTIVLAMEDPTNINNLDNLSRLLDRTVEPVLTTQEEIKTALTKYYGLVEQSVEGILSSMSSANTMSTLSSMSNIASMSAELSVGADIDLDDLEGDGLDSGGDGNLLDDDEDMNSPVVRYVHRLISEAFRLRASDIHIEPGKLDLKVRYRIDGVLHQMKRPPKRAQAAIISRLKIMSGMDIAERRIPQDGRIKIPVSGKMLDLRVSCLPSVYGETVVMRILDKSGLTLGLGQLGFCAEHQKTWEELLGQGTGIMLVTGPTGSGKTTTLYASLHKLNTPENKLITVEDPVEYMMDGINQVQINHEIQWTFARALRAIFRMDPDICMVGEIRDLETAEIAVRAALTGHLVFSTLHTNDAPSAFIRLIDMGVKPFLVASSVRVVLAQRLVRTICTNCKEPRKPTQLQMDRLMLPVDSNHVELFAGAGCENCGGTGYQGRLGVYELLMTTDNLRRMIMEGSSSGVLRRQARVEGMVTLREDAWQKALNGITSIEEVLRVTQADDPTVKRAVAAAPSELVPA